MEIYQLKGIESQIQMISLVDRASFFGGDIWQRSPDEKLGRHVSQIIEISPDLILDSFIVRSHVPFAIDLNLPVFVRLNYRNLIFKLFPGQFKVSGNRMSCLYPQEAYALEERQGGDRYVLPLSSDISLSLKRIERSIKDLTYEIELRIIDVSQRGFGISISAQNKDFLKKDDHFWLNSINHTLLPNPIWGTVCYVAPKGYNLKRGDVRVGVTLSRPLASDVLESLKRRSRIILRS
jgi:hypothetical protein